MSKNKKMSRKRFVKLVMAKEGRPKELKDAARCMVEFAQKVEKFEHQKRKGVVLLRRATGRLCWKEVYGGLD